MVRRAMIVSGLLAAGAVFLVFASKSEPVPIRVSLSEFPARIGVWEGGPSSQFNQQTLKVLGVDDYMDRVYRKPGGAVVSLYIGYYRSQRQGQTIHSPLNCLPGAGWNPVKKDYMKIPVESDFLQPDDVAGKTGGSTINRIVIQKGLDKSLVLYWYQSHGRTVASEYWGKIYAVIDAIRTNRTDGALVRVVCPIAGMEAAAESAAEQNAVDFVKSMFPLLDRFLPN